MPDGTSARTKVVAGAPFGTEPGSGGGRQAGDVRGAQPGGSPRRRPGGLVRPVGPSPKVRAAGAYGPEWCDPRTTVAPLVAPPRAVVSGLAGHAPRSGGASGRGAGTGDPGTGPAVGAARRPRRATRRRPGRDRTARRLRQARTGRDAAHGDRLHGGGLRRGERGVGTGRAGRPRRAAPGRDLRPPAAPTHRRPESHLPPDLLRLLAHAEDPLVEDSVGVHHPAAPTRGSAGRSALDGAATPRFPRDGLAARYADHRTATTVGWPSGIRPPRPR